jgi:hypothetical protein
MNRHPIVLAALLAVGGAAAVVTLPAAVRAEVTEQDFERFDERMKTGDTNAKRNAIAELGLKKDKKVAAKLLQYLAKEKDEDVKVAICQVIGEQGDPSVGGRLYAMFDDKKNKENTKFLAALLEGMGESDPKRQYENLKDAAKKWVVLNGSVAEAAYRGMALNHTKDTVDEFVKAANSIASPTTNDSAAKRAAYAHCTPVLNELLQKLTGQDIKDAVQWRKWWSDAETTYKPEAAGDKKDLNASDVYVNEGYRFQLKKPGREWSFKKLSGEQALLRIEALDEGSPAAWVIISVGAKEKMKSKTAEQLAEEVKMQIEEGTKDIRDPIWARKATYGGESAIETLLLGRDPQDGPGNVHNMYVASGPNIYAFRGFVKSGKNPRFKEDIIAIYKSLVFKK